MNQMEAVVCTLRKAIRSTSVSGSHPGLFFGMSRAIVTGALALAFLAGAIQTRAQSTDVWVDDSGSFSTAGNWSHAPVAGDTVLFTNNTSITVTVDPAFTASLGSAVISNQSASSVITIDATGNTLYMTNMNDGFRVGQAESTTTVYIAGGTIYAAGFVPAGVFTGSVLRVADASTGLYNCVASLYVTNGILGADGALIGAGTNSAGSLIISGPNAVYSDLGASGSGSTMTIGASASANSSVIVSNGGKLFVDGTLTLGNGMANTNCLFLLTGSGSAATITAAGDIKNNSSSALLIISNNATLFEVGSLLFGNSTVGSTGIIDHSTAIVQGSFQVSLGAAGSTNNFLAVQNGAYVSAGGTMAYGNNNFNVGNGFQMGGYGGPSTGLFVVVRSASSTTNHEYNFITVTNAFMSINYLNPQGPRETISVLANATLQMTNSASGVVKAGLAGTNAISLAGGFSTLLINSGTLVDVLTADNGGGLSQGGSGTFSIIVTNGGQLLTSAGTIGSGSALDTAIVSGVLSVWSNYTPSVFTTNIPMGFGPDYNNRLIVGTGAGGSNNYLGVFNGGSLYSAGTLEIGNNVTAGVNTVVFGGPGLPVFVHNGGSINIGSGAGTSGNGLIISNATLICDTINAGISTTNALGDSTNNYLQINGGTISANYLRVRGSNTIAFTAGSLNVGGAFVDATANGSNIVVVGDGVSAAFYDMELVSTNNYHNFGTGLTVTNGATLQGSGTLTGGNVDLLGSFAPGFSGPVGSIYASNNVYFGPSAQLYYDLGTVSAAYDTATINGNLGLGGTLNINNTGLFGVGTYTIFTYNALLTNVLTGTGGTLALGTEPIGGVNYAISTATPGFVKLVVSSLNLDFNGWESFFGLSGTLTGGNASYTGDGMNNTNKFMAGFNPTNGAAYLHVISVAKVNNNQDVKVTYLGASGDSTYTGGPGSRTNILEFTSGTANGSYSNNFASTGQTNILNGGSGFGQVTNMVDSFGATNVPSRYYRVRVLLP